MYLQVNKCSFVPADAIALEEIRDLNLKIGDIVNVKVDKIRSTGFNRYAHLIGKLVVENIDGFESLDAHTALKRLQLESGVECDEIMILLPNFGNVVQRVPRSFSFNKMSEKNYQEAIKSICDFVAKRYWSGMSAEEIEKMLSVM